MLSSSSRPAQLWKAHGFYFMNSCSELSSGHFWLFSGFDRIVTREKRFSAISVEKSCCPRYGAFWWERSTINRCRRLSFSLFLYFHISTPTAVGQLIAYAAFNQVVCVCLEPQSASLKQQLLIFYPRICKNLVGSLVRVGVGPQSSTSPTMRFMWYRTVVNNCMFNNL